MEAVANPLDQSGNNQYSTDEMVNPFLLPYANRLSFVPLIKMIERLSGEGNGRAFLANEALKRLEQVPAFREPIRDMSLLDKHRELVDLMLTFVVAPGTRDQQLLKIARPFSMDDIYASPRLVKLMKEGEVEYEMNRSDSILFCATVVRACSTILNKYYGRSIEIDPPIQLTVKKADSALPEFYKVSMNLDFVDIVVKGELPPLADEEIDQLLSNIYDTDRWLSALPPEVFEFHGFVMVSLVDITEEESLSRIKHHLLRRDAVLAPSNVGELESLLQTHLGIPDLRLGITAIDYPKENTVDHKYKIRFDFLADEVDDLLADRYQGSVYERVCQYRDVMLVEDLTKLKNKTELEERLLQQGLRSAIIATLVGPNDRVLGIVELGSPHPYGLHSFVELKFKELTGLFRMAVQRSREEVDNSIEAIIRERYTALHPSVEWRFIQSAFAVMSAQERGESVQQDESIVFKEVYPLYGQADIVSSSTKRNESIQADLQTELGMARKVLERSLSVQALPLVRQTMLHIDREMQHLSEAYNSSDETRIVDLLHTEVQPLLRQLQVEHADLSPLVKAYFERLDPELGVVYERRKDYDESVEMVNELISCYVDQQEKEMQEILPHYFEKYKTDGVEYEIYLGASILQQKDRFSDIHLRNFRLTQLIQMCEITRKVEAKKSELPEPMTTAQLIFAYTSPLSIRFRMDEKQFDVDGAYNVRYEILKKRIDKAVIEGSGSRLTRSGHVAIVYLQEKDRQEYLEYADYLLYEGYISEPPEELALAPLQGVKGLKALRLKVKL